MKKKRERTLGKGFDALAPLREPGGAAGSAQGPDKGGNSGTKGAHRAGDGNPERKTAPPGDRALCAPAPAAEPRPGQLFHNPYHFFPVGKRRRWEGEISADDLREGRLGVLAHDAYHSGRLSGRLLCRLTTETPTVVGGQQRNARRDGNGLTIVEPFELPGGDPGKAAGAMEPAIPATSLRGLASSLAEAASQSALRVLDDSVLSYRSAMAQALSAIGMVKVVRDKSGAPTYWLLPLTLPTLNSGNGYRLSPAFAKAFAHLEGRECLRIYLDRQESDRVETFSLQSPTFELRSVPTASRLKKNRIIDPDAGELKRKGRFLLGAQSRPSGEAETDNQVQGLFRALGRMEQRGDLPKQKKYELFLPFHYDQNQVLHSGDLPDGALEIPQTVVERFQDLSDERTLASLSPAQRRDPAIRLAESDLIGLHPYHPRGTRRNEQEGRPWLRLKTGDLVYFSVESVEGEADCRVTKISFSSIWRERVEKQGEDGTLRAETVHRFFEAVDESLLPFHSGRKDISPAESLFGFVEEDFRSAKEREKAPRQLTSYAGRLRFSAGRVTGREPPTGWYEKPIVLKILASPKPPSPALYFKEKGSDRAAFVRKRELGMAAHEPQGRKAYLHGKEDAQTRNREPGLERQKNQVTPLRAGLAFQFHIEFDNLTEQELGLLCFALRPSETFRHKLGMGKSLGLGTVRIDPDALFLVDRDRRYGVESFLSDRRYHSVERSPEADPSSWPALYRREADEAQGAVGKGWHGERMRCFESDMAPPGSDEARAIAAIRLIGNPAAIRHPVHVPQTERAGGDLESETFAWFVNNEKWGEMGGGGKAQGLAPITPEMDELPTLRRNAPPPRQR